MDISNMNEANIGEFCTLSYQLMKLKEAKDNGKHYFESFAEEEREPLQAKYDLLLTHLEKQEREVLDKIMALKTKYPRVPSKLIH